MSSDPHHAHGNKTWFVKHDGIGKPGHRMGEHEGPTPPLAGANKEHAGYADEFASEQDPGPHRFIIHTVSMEEN
ncbi:MAG: hypothetical protein ABI570_08990 [Ilumatobacteraceae bacterium]